jgi:hypothetical protein
MSWLIRYLFNLPARKKDYDEILEAFPEMLKKQEYSERERSEISGHFHFRDSYGRIDFRGNRIDFADLINWVEKGQDNIDQQEITSSSETNCPRSDCPLKPSTAPVEIDLRQNLTMAGGIGRKCSKDSFLNLVKHVHKGSQGVKEVIITDPYIYSDISEQGNHGGLDNFIEYLSALKLDKNSIFTITTTPSPKKFDEKSRDIFKKVVSENFNNARLLTYNSNYNFHDRLYLVRDNTSQLKGLFGPSLNGLNTNSIVLMGELDIDKDLHILKNWFL